MPDNQQVNLKIEDGLAWISKHGDDAKSVLVNLEDQIPKVISKSTSWMILGQLAKLPSAEVGDDDQRIGAYILLSIGRCPFPLIRTNIEGLPYFEHNFGDQGDVLCLEKRLLKLLLRRWLIYFQPHGSMRTSGWIQLSRPVLYIYCIVCLLL